jgi:hypothetical protein
MLLEYCFKAGVTFLITGDRDLLDRYKRYAFKIEDCDTTKIFRRRIEYVL